jgi:LuxR family maltose regulon positive regulatory protein
VRNQFDVAETLLSQLITEHPDGLQNEPILGLRVMLALALFGQHKINRTRQVMAEALRLAAPERCIRPFLEHGALCVPLLTLVLHTENSTAETKEFIKKILRITGHDSEALSSLPREYFDLSAASSITPREQEILCLLANGLSNGEIALGLSISESTVKTHLGNIYAKLNVNSRVQALSRAQVLKLV